MKKLLLFIVCALLLTACTGYNNSKDMTENNVDYEISSNGKEAMACCYQWDGNEDLNVITIPDTLEDGTPVNKMGGFIGIGVPAPFTIKYKVIWPALPKSSKQMSEEEINQFYLDYIADHPNELCGRMLKLSTDDTGSEDDGSGADTSTSTSDIDNDSTEREFVYKDITFTINIGKNVSSMGQNMSFYSICYDINHYGIVLSDGTVLVYRPSLYFNVDPENTTYYSEDGILYTTADGKPVVY